jgi:hypothetical protein
MLKVFWEVKQLDAQAVADRAKQGEMNAEPAAAGTSTATKAGNSLPKPPSWPADFELSMANAKLRNVPVSELNGEGITMFATSCRSSAARGFAIPGLHACPRADRRLGQWKTWVQSKAGPATTGDTYVSFAMLSTSAQQRMLKGFWEVKQREASQGQTAAAGTSTATKAGPPSSEPWPADFELSMANEKLRNVPVCQLNSEGITMLAELHRSSAAQGVVMLGYPAGRRPRLAQWKTWVQSEAAPATTGDTDVTFVMLTTSAQQHMLKSFWERKQREAS